MNYIHLTKQTRNMYIFRALIFVGIISLSTCRPKIEFHIQLVKPQLTNALLNYPDVPPKQQFNATAGRDASFYLAPRLLHDFYLAKLLIVIGNYYRDVWYVISAFSPKIPSNKSEDKTICIKFTSQLLENGNAREFYTQLYDGCSDVHHEIIINVTQFQNGVGKFIAKVRPDGKEGNTEGPFYPVRTTIIDTDYTNYSVEYKCIEILEEVICVYFIRSRKPYVLDPNVEPILNKLELKLQDFTLMNKPDCAEA